MKPCLPALLLAATLACSPALSLAETAAILAPDGRSSVRISDSDEILITDTATQQSRRLLSPKQDEDPKRQLGGFNNPAFSADGRSLYVLCTAWAVSDALHRIDLASGRTQFISAANDFQELHKGPHRGKLLLQKHTYRPQGGSSEVWYLGDPQGKVLKRIGNDAEKEKFVRQQERQGK